MYIRQYVIYIFKILNILIRSIFNHLFKLKYYFKIKKDLKKKQQIALKLQKIEQNFIIIQEIFQCHVLR